jgi:hypothetical protein
MWRKNARNAAAGANSFHHMIAFVGIAHSRDSVVDRAGHATPSAPPRCAIDLSHVIIKFRFCMTAAVSTKASAPASNTSPGTINPGKNSSCAKASIISKLTSRTPSVRARFVKQSERDRTGRACTFGLPGSQMPPDDNAASLGLSILDSRTVWIVNSETSDKLA